MEAWFSNEQIVEYRHAEDSEALAKIVRGNHPGASREETLFRYQLSKAVYLGQYDLPPLPTTAAQILRLGRNPNVAVNDYVKALQSDPSVVNTVIRIANSALFSGNYDYLTLEQAITRIGLAEVEKTVLLQTFNSKVFRVPGQGSVVRRLVQHGVIASLSAQAFGRLFQVPGSSAFIAGLFHDVGKFILLQILAGVQRHRNWTASAEVLESAFDAFHIHIGEGVCRAWEVPDHVIEAVACHHDPERASSSALNRSVYLGNRLAHAIEQGAGEHSERGGAFSDVVDSWFTNDRVATRALLTTETVHEVLDETRRDLAAYHEPLIPA